MQKQAHPYHLVNPSALPIVTSFILLILAVGALLSFHSLPKSSPIIGNLVLGGGFIGIIACMFAWWREVFHEAGEDKAHNNTVQTGIRIGFALFIISEIMFFVAFFWSYFNAWLFPMQPLEEIWDIAIGSWPPVGIETFDPFRLPFMNTLILLLSGTTVTWAHHAVIENKQKDVITALFFTVILGIIFTIVQAYEYSHAAFGFGDGIYASTFYMATGFHGFHVIIGTIFLSVCLFRAKQNRLTKKSHLGLELAAWYWHFVDVVWLFLFIFVYWLGGGS